MSAMHTQLSDFGLYSFDLQDSRRMTLLCQNSYEINICIKSYFTKYTMY